MDSTVEIVVDADETGLLFVPASFDNRSLIPTYDAESLDSGEGKPWCGCSLRLVLCVLREP